MNTDTDPNAPIRLRNGSEAPRSAVMTSWLAIKRLADSGDMGNVIALYEARELARNPAHQIWGGTGATLRNFALIDGDGRMHDITRDVILSSVLGDGTDVNVTFPVAAQDSTPQEPQP